MRNIIEAKIASLQELAGQLKGLSELKQSVADDAEYPPHNADELQKKAREHKRDAMAALTASATLKAVLDHGKTGAKQIALMQHYVLEFSQSMSRNAKLSNNLPEGDPRKEKIDNEGFSESFVINTLNEILGDIGADSRGQTSASKAAVHPTMAGRLGQVLSWAANIIALAIFALFVFIAGNETNGGGGALVAGLIFAAVIWAIGRGLRYVLAGV